MEGERIALGYMYVQLMNRCQTLALPSVPSVFCGSKVLRLSIVPSSKSRLMLCLEVGYQFYRALGVIMQVYRS